MLAEDGALLSVPAGVDAGLLLLVSIATDRAAFHPRHAIRLARGARLTLLELSRRRRQPICTIRCIEVQVAEDAALTHVRLQNEAPAAFHLSTVYAEIAERGTYDSFALNLGARIARTEVHVRLAGAEGHRASERRAVAWRRAARRLHHRGAARRAVAAPRARR